MGLRADITRHQRKQQGEGIPFSLNNGSVTDNLDIGLLLVDKIESSGITIRMSGFTLETGSAGSIPDPLRLDWYLYASGDYIMDNEPVWEGSTWWNVTGPKSDRNGQLVQVTGLQSQAWFLRVVMADPTVTVSLKGKLEYWCPDQPINGGPFLSTGPFVG